MDCTRSTCTQTETHWRMDLRSFGIPSSHRVYPGGGPLHEEPKALLRNRLLLHALLVFQMAACALAQEPSTAGAESENPHGPLKIACGKCHTVSAWKPIRSKPEFNHRKTGFPLRGMHSTVLCQECHVNPVFANVGSNCQDCHADIHRRKNGAQCDLCHEVYGWQVSIHAINEHQDRFPLIGAHAVADCYSCHTAGAVGKFNRQALSTECVSCHLRAFQKATSPNHVALGFSTQCEECHSSMDSWMVGVLPQSRMRR